ncbi:MAG: sensor histidine kinase, partial [Alphaproteobacteria bacterium]|nr:sensor histidine kinase [Alphaproteobacteria bacterium]
MLSYWRRNQSIATRLFLSAAAWSTILLLIAGIFLVTLYRNNTEQAFDDRLGVYLRALVADLAVGNEEQRDEAGQLGDPQFDLAQSGWYWQITRVDGNDPLVKQSPSLSGASLPRGAGAQTGAGGVRGSYIRGPDQRRLRMFERVIDIGAAGTYLIQVAATVEEVEDQIWRFKLALVSTFALLAIALVGTTALQVRYGLKPLRELQSEVAAIRHGDSERIAGR